MYIMIVSLSFLLRMRNVSDKSCRWNYNAHFIINIIFFFENMLFMRMWKNIVAPDSPLHAGHLCLQKHALTICNNYCFSTATIVAWTFLIFSLHVHCLSWSFLSIVFEFIPNYVTSLSFRKGWDGKGSCCCVWQLALTLQYLGSSAGT